MRASIVAILALAMASASCGGAGTAAVTVEPSTSATCVAVEATFSSIKTNILQHNCISCHANTLATYSQVTTGESNVGPLVDTDQPTSSRIYAVTNTGYMPQGGPKLCDAKIQAIRTWIEAGANDD